ncbi:MAG TPA: peptidylprolyl isomerase [Candidatus Acidoferrum sp.]|nr:peptidylprolyl isomerase [Candidatus Acidoferrum sp.]
MHKSGWMKIVALLILGAGLCTEARSQATAAQTPAAPKTGTTSAPAHKTAPTSPYDRSLLRPAMLVAKAPASYQVKFTTTKGDFVISVTRAWAPLGADRFYNLVRHHFYDNTTFFRVLRGFVVQWGISAYPPVTAAWEHAPIKDDPVVQSNQRGYLTYAMGGANTRTTQVFVNLVDNKRLDGMGFSAFGQVTEGMEVVEALYAGYGEGAPDGQGPEQDKIEKLGKSYLDKNFAQLDSIKTTTLILPPGAAPTAKPATKAPTGTPPSPKTTPASQKQP